MKISPWISGRVRKNENEAIPFYLVSYFFWRGKEKSFSFIATLLIKGIVRIKMFKKRRTFYKSCQDKKLHSE